MKVAMLGWEFSEKTGGLGTHCFNLSNSLSKKAEIHFLSPGKSSYTKDNLSVYGLDVDKEYHLSNEFTESAMKILKKKKFDVVHAHDWVTVPAALKAGELFNRPIVFTIHSLEYMRSESPNMQIESLEKSACIEADRIITVSKGMRDAIVKHYKISKNKIDVIYNSVTKKTIPKTKKTGKRVLFTSRLTKQKGPEYLLLAAKKILENNDAEFILVGDGHLLESLKKFSAMLGIDKKVSFAGFVTDKKLAEYYSSSDIFVQPSIHEPFGITILEAASFGLPIVTTDAGALEILRGGYLKARKCSSQSLANKIEALLSNSNLRKELSEEALKSIEIIPTWDDIAMETISTYNSVISS